MSAFLALVLACGSARSDVKTATDPGAGSIEVAHPAARTVEQLVALPAPRWRPHAARRASESEVVQVEAELVAYKAEEDGDYHVVVRGRSGATMVVELPDPACALASPYIHAMRAAREALEAAVGHPRRKVHRPRSRLRLRLVGPLFFDEVHGQLGVAPNGIEIHPVLALEVVHAP